MSQTLQFPRPIGLGAQAPTLSAPVGAREVKRGNPLNLDEALAFATAAVARGERIGGGQQTTLPKTVLDLPEDGSQYGGIWNAGSAFQPITVSSPNGVTHLFITSFTVMVDGASVRVEQPAPADVMAAIKANPSVGLAFVRGSYTRPNGRVVATFSPSLI